ncbi:GNAT family N-acetyltransferase [Fictibacillus nanhaiensis]|uniref:GNAT family N-acetyltransferase n=1 Tax=Fictibacillus nanhaiensis TaxID=742169 RepID=UPI001C96039D|nr:GNAT family N-acetyltransferase [Fictibacillus nanhaiensis]MBY6036610.1 GNAT family N-acetyltransferase [Fictibacillus nanhaiensis]
MKQNNTLSKKFTIDCGDIYLREFTVEDAIDIYNIASEKEISTFLPDWKSTKEQRLDWVTNYEIPANKEFLKAVSGTPAVRGEFLKLGIILKETGKFIGWCCTGIKDDLPEPNREIMYAISENFLNRGFATKASKGLISFLFKVTNLETLNAVALTHNHSSNKVIEKCGFRFVGNMEIGKDAYYYYRLQKNEWAKQNR